MEKEKYESESISTKQKIGVIFGAFVLSGIVGFIYETIFYYFNDGMIVKRGTSFGPWIQIYAFGGMIILCLCYRLRKKPFVVFLLGGAVSGIFEYIVGWCIYRFNNGYRSWDYNNEILNFGNIDGFVCLRSVLFFAFAGCGLIYIIIPTLVKIAKKTDPKIFFAIMLAALCVVAADIIYNDVLAKIINTPTAGIIYQSIGRTLN